MNKIYVLLLLILLIPDSTKSQTIWTPYTPDISDTIGIYDIDLTDANTAWFVGFRSDVPSPGRVIRTTDGGATFTVNNIPLSGAPFLPSITSTDANTAYVTALQDWGNAITLKTTDGGQTWQNTNTPWDPVVSWPDVIHAFSPAKICQIGDPREGEFEIYTTGNGGINWTRIAGEYIPDPLPGEFGFNNSGDFSGNHIWFGTNLGRLFHSPNAGNTWDVVQTPVNAIGGVNFSDQNNGIVAGLYLLEDSLSTGLFRTIDGGTTWSEITIPIGEIYHYYGVPSYIEGTKILVAGTYTNPDPLVKNQTWVSKDRGDTWTQISEGEMLGWPTFYSPAVGWAGEWVTGLPTRVFKYSDDALDGLFSLNELDADITISPNPTRNIATVHVQTSAPDDFVMLLNDVSGKLLQRINIKNTDEFTQNLDIQHLPTGVYTLTVSTQKGLSMQKILKN